MIKKILLLLLLFSLGGGMLITIIGCREAIINLKDHNISDGITKKEVIDKLGTPESVGIKDGQDQLYYTIHDHAFDNDKNTYVFIFKNDKLIEFYPVFVKTRESQTTVIPIPVRIRK